MIRKIKKTLALFLALLTIIISLYACQLPWLDESLSESSSSSETVSDSSSESSATNESSSESENNSDISAEISEESTEPQDSVVNFLACPDNIIHPSVFYNAIQVAARNNGTTPSYNDLHNAEYDFSPIYKNVASLIENADIAYINQETLVGGTSGPVHGYPRFNSPIAIGEEVVDLGFDVVNVAHNHMLDSNDTSYLEFCNDYFENKGLEVIGYYPTQDSVENITVIEKEDIRIAFLAYTYSTNGIRPPSGTSFVIPYFEKELVRKQVAAAKLVADVIIVSCHWGYEDTFGVNSEQKEYATLMCELGVDVVLGMHPHVIQPMQWMTSETGSKTLVVYSLGNFVSGMVAGRNMLAGMLSLDIRKSAETGEITIESPVFIPTVTHYTAKEKVASNDTGYRDFEICYLYEYTQEKAAEHGVCKYEKSNGTTLVGGGFSKDTLLQTLYKYIPLEFLPEEYQTEQ